MPFLLRQPEVMCANFHSKPWLSDSRMLRGIDPEGLERQAFQDSGSPQFWRSHNSEPPRSQSSGTF